MIGIDNYFIIKNNFDNNNIFEEAQIHNVNWQYISNRLELELITNCEVNNTPEKWKDWNSVYIKIDFFGIKDIK